MYRMGNSITLQRGDELSEVLSRLGLNQETTIVVRKRPFTDRDTAMSFLETKTKSIMFKDRCLAVAVQLPDTPEYQETHNTLMELTQRIQHMPLSWEELRKRTVTAMLTKLARINELEHSVDHDSRINYWMIHFNRNDNDHIDGNRPQLHQAH